ncbi:MAG: 30S ribosomal protein S12 methylthiotransferase RimO [Spirochaetales bacterium]|nr:30S ribosomal protein S12 methylthiotransferase RimO [Spirochaetales bacterium]
MKELFYIESLGCAKNQVDSEVLIALLEDSGLLLTNDINSAHYIIVNTCGFIVSAKQESIDTVLSLKQQYPDKKLLMVGCLVERYADELFQDLPEVDGFMGNKDLRSIITVWRQVKKGERAMRVPKAYFNSHGKRTVNLLSYPGSAYVKLAEGCNNNCTYCAIPLIRGPLHSRPQQEIVKEVKCLLDRGVREIILIAQDLASFGLERGTQELVPLLKKLLNLPDHFWLRLLYIHPDRFPLNLLDIVRHDARVLPYFDLPFQHASPILLKSMGRQGNSESYVKLIDSIRNTCARAVIRSTFLVGFPGESREDFQMLLKFQQSARLNWAGVFCYSREQGTPAAGFSGQVKKAAARARAEEFKQAQSVITEEWLDSYVNSMLDVLVEERVEKEALYIGRGYLHAPDVDGLVVLSGGNTAPGKMVKVAITKRNGVDLEGTVC